MLLVKFMCWFGSSHVAANLLFLPPAVVPGVVVVVGVDVAKRKLPSGQSLSRSAPGDVSRGGVVLYVMCGVQKQVIKCWLY